MLRRAPILLTLTALVLAAGASPGLAADLWVGQGAGCSDAYAVGDVATSAQTWCTLAHAAAVAAPGDTIHVLAGTYAGTVRFDHSGTPDAPIRVQAAEPGVVVDAAGQAQALKLMDVSDVQIAGLRATGGLSQGIWVQGGARVLLSGLDVSSNPGAGLSVKGAAQLTLADSTVADNGSAGILELAGTTGASYTGNAIHGNGVAGSAYNGDGLQLGGTGATVTGNAITGNGGTVYEHGIYTGAASSGWTIERNTVADNAGADIKAAGGPGLIRRDRLTNGTFGLILSDNPAVVTVEHNVIDGRAQHLVFLTAGAVGPARARLWANTVVQTGRSTSSGDASAVFVNAAASLELRDNLLSYAGADGLGVALWVNDPSRLGSLVSDTNWLTARDLLSRHVAWAGTRVTLAGWRAASGQDLRSLSSWAPSFDAERHVTSTNWGAGRGDNLGLPEDYAGAPLPPAGPVDIGAYQTSSTS